MDINGNLDDEVGQVFFVLTLNQGILDKQTLCRPTLKLFNLIFFGAIINMLVKHIYLKEPYLQIGGFS